MKKWCVLLFSFFVLFSSIAFAMPPQFPNPNTDQTISFRGFEWYGDYAQTIGHAKEEGFTKFDVDMRNTEMPYWDFFENHHTSVKECGININIKEFLNVADHKAKLSLYLLLNHGKLDSYKSKDSVQFYMAIYRFDSTDEPWCYGDLLRKLKTLYGEDPLIRNKNGQIAYWIDSTNAMICLYRDGMTMANVYLMYIAPDSNQRLTEVEERVKKGIILYTPDPNDYNGLIFISQTDIAMTVKITATDGAKVRSGPNTSYSYIGKAESGHEYEYLETASNGWYKIKLNDGTVGYISGKMGKITDISVSSSQESKSEQYVSWTLTNKREVQVTKSIYDDMMTYYDWMDQGIYHMFWLQDYDSKEFKEHAAKASSMEALAKKCNQKATRNDDKKFIKDIEDIINERIKTAASWL